MLEALKISVGPINSKDVGEGKEVPFLLFFLFEIHENLVNQLDSGREAERYTEKIKVKEKERERGKEILQYNTCGRTFAESRFRKGRDISFPSRRGRETVPGDVIRACSRSRMNVRARGWRREGKREKAKATAEETTALVVRGSRTKGMGTRSRIEGTAVYYGTRHNARFVTAPRRFSSYSRRVRLSSLSSFLCDLSSSISTG